MALNLNTTNQPFHYLTATFWALQTYFSFFKALAWKKSIICRKSVRKKFISVRVFFFLCTITDGQNHAVCHYASSYANQGHKLLTFNRRLDNPDISVENPWKKLCFYRVSCYRAATYLYVLCRVGRDIIFQDSLEKREEYYLNHFISGA